MSGVELDAQVPIGIFSSTELRAIEFYSSTGLAYTHYLVFQINFADGKSS
jgi:hypothetical protein